MAWIATDADGTEFIFPKCPERFWNHLWGDETQSGIRLPPGSIRRLIGRDLTWNDEPVELT